MCAGRQRVPLSVCTLSVFCGWVTVNGAAMVQKGSVVCPSSEPPGLAAAHLGAALVLAAQMPLVLLQIGLNVTNRFVCL